MLPQGTIGRVGVGIEFARQLLDVEIGRQLSRIRIHAAILTGRDRYAVFALSKNAVGSIVPPEYSLADRLEIKMHARTDAPPETAASWPEDIFAILQRFDVRQVPYVPDAGHSELIERVLGASSMRAVPLT